MKPVKLRLHFEEYAALLLIDNSLFVRDMTDDSVAVHIPAQVVNTLVDEITGMSEEEMRAKDDKIADLERRLETAEDEARYAEEDADDLRRDLDDAKENIIDLEGERDQLTERVKELEDRMSLWERGQGDLPY